MTAGTMLALAVTLPLRADAPPGETTAREVRQAIAALNRAFEKGNAAAAGRLLTGDHVAITPYYGGPLGRAEQLRSLPDLKLDEYAAGEMKVTPLGRDAALVTYLLTLRGAYRGRPVPRKNYAAAVWVRRGGRWLEAAYQETPLGGE